MDDRVLDQDDSPDSTAEDLDATFPFLGDVWLRAELSRLIEDFGAGMAERQVADPARLLTDAIALLTSQSLLASVEGGVLVLPLLARYRSVAAQIKSPQTRTDAAT
jgi:hypothetical protein